MIIRSINNLHVKSPKTFLTNLEVGGTNILRWKNPAGFNASWAIQVGEIGEAQTEVVLLGASTPAGTAGTLTANTLYEHPADTPIYGIKYDQVVFERSTVGTTGTASPISNGTITYQPNNIDFSTNTSITIFDDTTGSASYGYRTYFRSSVLVVNSLESDWMTSSGFSFYSLGGIRQRVRNRMWDTSFIKDDSVINDWINEWKDVLTNAAIQVNEDYAIGTVGVSFGTDGLGTISSTDFKQSRRMWVKYDSINKYQSTKMSSNDFIPQDSFISTHPYHNWQGDTIFQIHPSDLPGTVELEYYKLNSRLVNDTDELPNPMKGYTDSFVNYAEAQAYAKDQKWEAYDRKMGQVNSSKDLFITESVPRDNTGADYITLTEPITGDTSYW